MGISKRHVWFLEGKCPVPNTKCSCSSISHCWPVCEVYPFFKRALGGGGVVLRERVVIWCCLWQGTSCQFKDVLVIFVGKQTAFGQSPFNVAQGLYYILITSNKWWHTHFQEYGFTWIGKTICCKCLFYKFFPKLQGIFQANVIFTFGKMNVQIQICNTVVKNAECSKTKPMDTGGHIWKRTKLWPQSAQNAKKN